MSAQTESGTVGPVTDSVAIRTRLAGVKYSDGNYIFSGEVRVACERTHYQGKECWACQGRCWTASADGWEEAVVVAGAEVCRTWYDRAEETWVADVRFLKCQRFVTVGETADEARIYAIFGALKQIPGVEFPDGR